MTVPVEVRRLLGLRTPDRVVFVVDEEAGTVRLEGHDYPDLDSLAGAAGTLARSFSWDEMREIARDDRLEDKFGARS
ncbi:MAG: AbrB/MazE/SpoVT family DNA-binding domain-containing protein [Chloroflexota bacterium]|nr:AbrB/MazE/SpoVT family DNA-binding domain-containing protein [Chloroflexota bacterium]